MNSSTPNAAPLRQRMLDDMRMRKLEPKTQAGYLRAVRHLAVFLNGSPDTATVEDLRRFQLHMVDKGTSPITLNATDYRAKSRTRHKTMTLGADEFMRRFLLHVLPGGLHRIRHYGLLANGCRKANLARVRELLRAVPAAHAQPQGSQAEVEPAKPCFFCLHCGAAMLVIQTFARGQSIRAPPQKARAP